MRPLIVAVLLAVFSLPAKAQVNNEKYHGFLLVGEFGELCTMCEAIVLCEASNQPRTHKKIPATGNFTLYHVQTRTFWSQMSTIWEWFIANFDSESLAQGHSRPVLAYQVSQANWSGPIKTETHLALEPPLISFSNLSIDRRDGRWVRDIDNKTAGYCQRMPLWESLETISASTAVETP
ncbi:MAG: hypothetical protein GY779_04165 [Gammaproteobacteria bacterium]|nr:hypothetical protein [Gammaproteobacteria bacterium]